MSGLLKKAVDDGELTGMKITRTAPGISHLLFADDSTLFFQAKQQQAEVVKNVIHKFEGCTGQLPTTQKSSLLFSSAWQVERQEEVKSTLGKVRV